MIAILKLLPICQINSAIENHFFRCDYPYKIDREFFRVHYGEQYALSAFARDGITFRQIIIFRREFGNVNSSEETPKRFW